MRASSAAANREDWIVAEPIWGSRSSGNTTRCTEKPPSGRRVTVTRVNWVSMSALVSAGPRTISSTSRPLSTTAFTDLPMRPCSTVDASGSLRMNWAAAASSAPRRLSRLSTVSADRVTSLRYRRSAWRSSACSWVASAGGSTASVTWVTKGMAESGKADSGATPKAVTAEPASTVSTAALKRRGWR